MTSTTKHIALICPGGPLSREIADKLGDFAAESHGDGVQLHFHDQCFDSAGHFAGDDATRSTAFLDCANDPAFDAIWFARGGYGSCRLSDDVYHQLNDAARKKIYLGYSDIGIILARLYAMNIGTPVHGPMPSEFLLSGGQEANARALAYLVDGTGDAANEDGGAPRVAFNITVLASIISAPWFPKLTGHVLMLEDVGEYLYRIDRSLSAIFSSGKLDGLKGVRLGRISEVPQNDRPFGASDREIFEYWCERRNISFLGNADIGHDGDNSIVPFGA